MSTWRPAVLLALFTLAVHVNANPIAIPLGPKPGLPAHHARNLMPQPPQAASLVAGYEVRGTYLDFTNDAAVAFHAASRDYGLRNSESFYWGPANNPNANFTAYLGEDNVKVLSIERFADLVSVQCSASSVVLSFNDDVGFDDVAKDWEWVNGADDNYIVFVTENGCLIESRDRQAWHVKHATFDNATNVVTLSAEPKEWKDAFGRWHLRFSSKGLFPHNDNLLFRRDEDLGIPLDADFSTEGFGIDDDSIATIACDPCNTAGSLDFDFDVDYDAPVGLTGKVTITPNAISATITAKLAIGGELASIPMNKNLFDFHPNGIDLMDGLVTVGPGIYVDFVGNFEASAEAELSAGVTMSIPDDSSVVLYFDDTEQNSISGWTPYFDHETSGPSFSESVSLAASAGLRIRVEFDAQVKGKGLSGGLALDAPTLSFGMDGGLGSASCGGGGSVGLEVDVSLGAELNAFGGWGVASDMPNKMAITSTGMNIFSTCAAVGASDSTAASSVASVTPPSGSISASPSSHPSSSVMAPSSSFLISSTIAPSSSVGPLPSSGQPSSIVPYSSQPRASSAAPSSFQAPSSSRPISSEAISSEPAFSSEAASSSWPGSSSQAPSSSQPPLSSQAPASSQAASSSQAPSSSFAV
ncbi:hypothetical protein LTR37_004657 [Vermiconidia calcicola]|uniref:Uncharacterized protein n=1 Tax=Vermiconidia calcicola TaxID=1690605 RepID=A0ACC3NLU6_9PEZI|nr:hypothetical protein LTR37_004657 [Vermiconidia calcicola]